MPDKRNQAPELNNPFLQAPEKNEEKKSNDYLPMLHGKSTDALAIMTSKNLVSDRLSNTATIESHDVTLTLGKIDELTGKLGVSTHKLLSTCIALFTESNHVSGERQLRTLRVSIPLREYAAQCGYDVTERETSTPEEAKKEAARVENNIKNARRKIKKDLDILYNASISWKEKVKGKEQDFVDVRIIGAKAINKGRIYLEFTSSMGEYLIMLPMTQYPTTLLKVDERNSNAYNIGLKMAEHFSMDNNQISGTAQLLKVASLLRVTSLPDANSSTVKKVGWETRIKEPFENALDALTNCGLLKDWRYSHSKGVEMTDEEATNFSSFEDWSNTLIKFTLTNPPDHGSRLAERLEAAKDKKKSKK